MKIGYIRVSTEKQNPARQEILMKELGVEKLFLDKISGKNTDRPEYEKMMNFIREGDVLITESYSRLARNTKDLLNIVEKLKEKGVGLVSKKENIDTTTPQGKFMLTVFAGLYEFERECMLERQKEGIAIAKAQGKFKGRKPIEVDQVQFSKLYTLMKSGEISKVSMYKKLGLPSTTFYRKLKQYEKELR